MSFIRNQAVTGLPDTSYRMRVSEGKSWGLGGYHFLAPYVSVDRHDMRTRFSAYLSVGDFVVPVLYAGFKEFKMNIGLSDREWAGTDEDEHK